MPQQSRWRLLRTFARNNAHSKVPVRANAVARSPARPNRTPRAIAPKPTSPANAIPHTHASSATSVRFTWDRHSVQYGTSQSQPLVRDSRFFSLPLTLRVTNGKPPQHAQHRGKTNCLPETLTFICYIEHGSEMTAKADTPCRTVCDSRSEPLQLKGLWFTW